MMHFRVLLVSIEIAGNLINLLAQCLDRKRILINLFRQFITDATQILAQRLLPFQYQVKLTVDIFQNHFQMFLFHGSLQNQRNSLNKRIMSVLTTDEHG